MKRLIFAIALLIAVGYGVHSCAATMDADAEKAEQRRKDWEQFSQVHHCKVVSNGFGRDTWECDGNFQVMR
jgi:hypothetical protein